MWSLLRYEGGGGRWTSRTGTWHWVIIDTVISKVSAGEARRAESCFRGTDCIHPRYSLGTEGQCEEQGRH